MPRYNDILNNFINGEISAKAYGRSDSEIYKRACKRIENMLVHPQGGASRRGGSSFVADKLPRYAETDLEDIADGARIIPFVVSKDESYLLIFNKSQETSFLDNVLQYYHVQGRALGTAIFQDNLIVGISGPVSGRFSSTLSNAENDNDLIDSDVLAEMQYVQIGQVMVFVHPSVPPFCVIRDGPGSLRYVAYSTQFKGPTAESFGPWPFMEQNGSDVNIDSSATAIGACTLTSSAALFNAEHIGSMFAFQDAGTVGLAIVTAFTSTTVVDATIYRTLPAAALSNTKQWYECAWSNYRGWPRTVAYWNGKIHFGGSDTFPDRLWTSQLNDLFEMTNFANLDPGTADTASDPAFFDLATTAEVNEIQWLAVSGNDLLVGARGREYAIDSLNISEVSVKPQTGYGSEYIQPCRVDDVSVYVQRGGRKIREIIFEERTAGYVSPDATFLAEHIARKSRSIYSDAVAPRIKSLAYQALDNNILWAVDVNGYLLGCTKSRENSVTAWHRHELGGVFGSDIPKVISIASVPSEDGTFDELYMLVKRTINAATKVTLEKLGQEFYGVELDADSDERTDIPVFVDCAKVYRTHATAANFYARLRSSINADAGGGTLTGTATGAPSFVDGMALFESNEAVAYDGTSNADFAQTGTIRFTVMRPRGTCIAVAQSAASSNNLIRIRYDVSNGWRVTINNSAGAAIINDVIFGFAFGATYAGADGFNGPVVMELNYNITTGATRLFANGKQVGATVASTGTRDTAIDIIRVGANYDNGDDSGSMLLGDVLIWSTVQHTAEHEIFEYQPKDTTIERLEMYEGLTVKVLGDGRYVGAFVVTSGVVSLGSGNEFDTLVVGLSYRHLLEPMPIDAGAGIGSAQGAIKRIDRAVIRFRDSAAASVGVDESTAEEITFRAEGALATVPIALVTDDKIVAFPGDYTRLATCVIMGEDPLPCSVTCAIFRGQTYD